MSICKPCVKTETITLCADSLIIGEVPAAATEYIVWFRNLATGSVYGYTATSDVDKKLTLNFPEGFPLAGNTLFEMWVNKPGDNFETTTDLFIDSRIANCFLIKAEDAKPMVDGYLDQPTSQTLKIKS
jgi:hypothetical protein